MTFTFWSHYVLHHIAAVFKLLFFGKGVLSSLYLRYLLHFIETVNF